MLTTLQSKCEHLILAYENTSLQRKALALIPLQQLKEKAQKKLAQAARLDKGNVAMCIEAEIFFQTSTIL